MRESFFNEPWIEIDGLDPLFELIGEGTILHVGRARGFAQSGKWNLAIEQLERGKDAPLPVHAAQELEREITEYGRLRDLSATQGAGGARR